MATLQAYWKIKILRREPMCINAVKLMIPKFVVTTSLNVVLGREWHATAPAILEEVATARSSNAAVSWLFNSTSTKHSVGNCANNFMQNSEALPSQIAFHATIKTTTDWFWLNSLIRMQVDEYWPSHTFWTDEVHIHLDSAVNTQNCCIWGSTNPHAMQQLLHSP